MNEAEKITSDKSPLEHEGAARKPYEKPAFRQERLFETGALSCGKVQATQGSCRANRKTS